MMCHVFLVPHGEPRVWLGRRRNPALLGDRREANGRLAEGEVGGDVRLGAVGFADGTTCIASSAQRTKARNAHRVATWQHFRGMLVSKIVVEARRALHQEL